MSILFAWRKFGPLLPFLVLILFCMMAQSLNIDTVMPRGAPFVSDTKHMVNLVKKKLEFVGSAVVKKEISLEHVKIFNSSKPSLPYTIPPESSFVDFDVGGSFGGKQKWFWFSGDVVIDETPYEHSDAVELEFSVKKKFLERTWDDGFPAAEGMLFLNGREIGAIDNEHISIPIDIMELTEKDILRVHVVFFAGRCDNKHDLSSFSVKIVDIRTRELFYDMKVLLEILEEIRQDSEVHDLLLRILVASVNALDVRGMTYPVDIPGYGDYSMLFYETVPGALDVLHKSLQNLPNHTGLSRVHVMGHAHIDACWLWPFSLSHHKIVHTFRTQTRLLKRFPEWTFLQSTPQFYKWLEKDNPELLKTIKELVIEGRWVPEGALWCECDTNLVSGESLVRQLLHGKMYLKEVFNIDSKIVWLPDAFGYSGALPQLLQQAGIELFVTSKISWSEYNEFPHHTFIWRGTDSKSMIPVQFITTPTKWGFLTYNALMNANELKGINTKYKQKNLGTPLMTFGIGDGGGGPTPKMLEKVARFSKIPHIDDFPKAEFSNTQDLVSKITKARKHLPVWKGELYLEYHRGTYTSQAWLKRVHRKLESEFHNIEWIQSLLHLIGMQIPHSDRSLMKSCWERLLLLEFHDSLPGSSVGEAYDEVRQMVEVLDSDVANLRSTLLGNIVSHLPMSEYGNMKSPALIINTLPWEREYSKGNYQQVPSGGWLVVETDIESVKNMLEEDVVISEDMKMLSNKHWRLEFNNQWELVSVLDKSTGREIVQQDRSVNSFEIFEDRPIQWDAWDINLYYKDSPLEKPKCVKVERLPPDGDSMGLRMSWEFPSTLVNSTLCQDVILYRKKRRIDFKTEANWEDHHQILKAAFPVRIHSEFATYQIQFGHIRRSTHNNTSWDMAQFEVPAHRFIDLSEYGYGVSLLSDNKYGYDIKDGVMRITLIKSPLQPDKMADRGHHEFTYSLFPHEGTFQGANIPKEAEELVKPLIVHSFSNGTGVENVKAQSTMEQLSGKFEFIKIDSDAVVLDTLKLPFNDSLDGVLLRFYESFGSHAKAKISFPSVDTGRMKVSLVDILERKIPSEVEEGKLELKEGKIEIEFDPFEIKTILLEGRI